MQQSACSLCPRQDPWDNVVVTVVVVVVEVVVVVDIVVVSKQSIDKSSP